MELDAAAGPVGADLSSALRRAMGLLASDAPAAETLARAALALAPDNRDAQTILGAALRLKGDPAAARAVLEPLAAAEPGSWIVHWELARTLMALGLSRPATPALERAVALNPGLTGGWRLLADLRTFAGEFAAAGAAEDRALRSMIQDPRLGLLMEAFVEGRLDEVESVLRSRLEAEPGAPPVVYLLGETLLRSGRLIEAEALLARCRAEAPGFAPARHAHATALLRCGRAAEAVRAFDQLIADDPGDQRARLSRFAALGELGDFAAATEETAALLEVFPDQPQGWLVHAHGLRMLGRTREAIAALRRALALDPGFTAAWWGLANLRTYRFTPAERTEIEALLARPDLSADDRANLLFTLGKAEEDAGRFGPAFDHYARGNAIQHARRPYDPRSTSDFVARSKSLLSKAFFAARAGWGAKAADPIFILGMPRSGSTLVDQILASHPAVEGTRELQDLRVIADWIGAVAPGYPDAMAALPREVCLQRGRDYLDWTRAQRRTGRPRFTDKAPWNWRHVGLIQLILPHAKIIDVRRHPMACCLSAFKSHFHQGWEFAYELESLGRYYADYVELMAHIDSVLPGRVHRVIYERLVDDAEGEVRRLLAYLDLPFDPACLKFHETPRAIATPSSEQVRQPIYRDAIDQWRNFEPWLDPLRAALGKVLEAYPEAPGP
jgi:tetratricopeptide (TPR) repeat protein